MSKSLSLRKVTAGVLWRYFQSKKILGPKDFGSEKNISLETRLVLKTMLVLKRMVVRNFFCLKRFFGQTKNFGPEKSILFRNKFWVCKNFESKTKFGDDFLALRGSCIANLSLLSKTFCGGGCGVVVKTNCMVQFQSSWTTRLKLKVFSFVSLFLSSTVFSCPQDKELCSGVVGLVVGGWGVF